MASTLKFDRIEILDGTYGIDVNDITQSNVVQTHLTSSSSQAITAGVVTAIVDLNATITPTRTTSRIKVTVKWSGEWGVINTQDCVFGLNRGGIAVGNADIEGVRYSGITGIAYGYYSSDANSTQDSFSFTFIDSPSTTSPILYEVTAKYTASSTLYNQRTVNGADSAAYERLTSTIILEEVGP